jgi:uncharacterized protein YrrD
MMRFREGAQVITAHDEPVGEVERVVLDPQTKEVSHLVVREGLLFTTDKVVPLSLVGSATRDRVVLRTDSDGLEELPDFEVTHYVPAYEKEARAKYPEGTVGPLYWYPPAGVGAISTGYGVRGPAVVEVPTYRSTTEQNIPENALALKEGAKVISSDNVYVGNVKSVLTDGAADRATHLVIERGLLLKEEKLVPIQWVSWFGEDEAHLSVGSQLLESLPAYG